MRVVLFRGGRPGVAARLPGENVDVELSDLLGGALAVEKINRRLELLQLAEPGRLPVRYKLHRLGMEPAEIRGDCVVVVRREDGGLRSASDWDVADALAYVRGVRQHE